VTKIVPAVLTGDPADLEIKIRQAEQFTDIAQIDIMDGKFVPSRSIGSEDLKKIKTRLYLEVHIMAVEPQRYFQAFAEAGAKRILFHFEATDKPAELIKQLREMNISPGIVINPQTKIEAVKPFFGDIDILLLMAVRKPRLLRSTVYSRSPRQGTRDQQDEEELHTLFGWGS
jgi:ribulose-phosphate 3-epimerase